MLSLLIRAREEKDFPGVGAYLHGMEAESPPPSSHGDNAGLRGRL